MRELTRGLKHASSRYQALFPSQEMRLWEEPDYTGSHHEYIKHPDYIPVSYTHLRAHETLRYLVCRLLLEKKK